MVMLLPRGSLQLAFLKGILVTYGHNGREQLIKSPPVAGSMVMLQRLMEEEWHVTGGQFNGGRMVMLQRWSV